MKTLLLPLFGEPIDQVTLSTAIALARRFSMHMDMIVARADATAVFSSVGSSALGLAFVTPTLLEEFETQEAARITRAMRHFTDFCRDEKVTATDEPPGPEGVSARWWEVRGSAADVILRMGRVRDLVVVANTAPGDRFLFGELAELFELGRPLLLAATPVPKSVGRRIAIAWKDALEAARAVAMAMPLLARAEKISIFSVDEEDGRSGRASLDPLLDQLRWHRFAVEGTALSRGGRPVREVFLEAAENASADLVVMGAYGHSRIRETVFGGFTHDMLRGAPLPMFMVQ